MPVLFFVLRSCSSLFFGSLFFGSSADDAGFRLHLPAIPVHKAAHAVALDEDRTMFPVSDIVGAEQKAFRGAHSDIGGGYGAVISQDDLRRNPQLANDPETGLSNITLHWMIDKGVEAGAPFDRTKWAFLKENPQMKPHREVGWKAPELPGLNLHTGRDFPADLPLPDGYKRYNRIRPKLQIGSSNWAFQWWWDQ